MFLEGNFHSSKKNVVHFSSEFFRVNKNYQCNTNREKILFGVLGC